MSYAGLNTGLIHYWSMEETPGTKNRPDTVGGDQLLAVGNIVNHYNEYGINPLPALAAGCQNHVSLYTGNAVLLPPPLTVDGWCKAGSISSGFAYPVEVGSSGNRIRMYPNSSNLWIFDADQAGHSGTDNVWFSASAENVWRYFCIRLLADGITLVGQIDQQAKQTLVLNGTPWSQFSGVRAAYAGNGTVCAVDEFAVWDRVLDDDEVFWRSDPANRNFYESGVWSQGQSNPAWFPAIDAFAWSSEGLGSPANGASEWNSHGLDRPETGSIEWSSEGIDGPATGGVQWFSEGLGKPHSGASQWSSHGIDSVSPVGAEWSAEEIGGLETKAIDWDTAGLDVPEPGGLQWDADGLNAPENGNSEWSSEGLDRPRSGSSQWSSEQLDAAQNGFSEWNTESIDKPEAGGSQWQTDGLDSPVSGNAVWAADAIDTPHGGGWAWQTDGLETATGGGTQWSAESIDNPETGFLTWASDGLEAASGGGSQWTGEPIDKPHSGGSQWRGAEINDATSGGSQWDSTPLQNPLTNGGCEWNSAPMVDVLGGGAVWDSKGPIDSIEPDRLGSVWQSYRMFDHEIHRVTIATLKAKQAALTKMTVR